MNLITVAYYKVVETWRIMNLMNLTQLLCTHETRIRSRRETVVLQKGLECLNCGRFFPYPEELTRASGVFARIDERVENEKIEKKRALHV